MSVFGHGQLRLYLLALLRQGPRHGYDIIRDLEERFAGLYSPSAGTVYPRLAKLEEEGLVVRTDDGRKALYRLTDAGRAEVAAREDELAALETSLDASADRLAEEVRRRVRSGVADLRSEIDAATARWRVSAAAQGRDGRSAPDDPDEVPAFDIDALIGGLSRGQLPDTEALTRAMRRWGGRQGTGRDVWSAAADDPADPHVAAGDAPAHDEAQGPLGDQDLVAELDPASDQGDVSRRPEQVQEGSERASSAVGDGTGSGTWGGDGASAGSSGFPSSAQVREVIAILKDAGHRISEVMDPGRGDRHP